MDIATLRAVLTQAADVVDNIAGEITVVAENIAGILDEAQDRLKAFEKPEQTEPVVDDVWSKEPTLEEKYDYIVSQLPKGTERERMSRPEVKDDTIKHYSRMLNESYEWYKQRDETRVRRGWEDQQVW